MHLISLTRTRKNGSKSECYVIKFNGNNNKNNSNKDVKVLKKS